MCVSIAVCFCSGLYWKKSYSKKKSIIILKTLMKAMHRQDIFLFNLLEVVIRLVVSEGRKTKKNCHWEIFKGFSNSICDA